MTNTCAISHALFVFVQSRKTPDYLGDTSTRMPRRKTKKSTGSINPRVDKEQIICKRKLDELEQAEILSNDDRFSFTEKQQLLEAYNKHGFQIFQNTELLKQYFENRSETQLKHLLQRLKNSLTSTNLESDNLDDWQQACMDLMGNFAKDKRVNIDNLIADAVAMLANKLEASGELKDGPCDYVELLRSFSQLLARKFPDQMSSDTARISMKLYQYINTIVDSSESESCKELLRNSSWLNDATRKRRKNLEEAKKAFDEDSQSPSVNEDDYAKYLELPKVKRLIEFLNPLRIDPQDFVELLELPRGD